MYHCLVYVSAFFRMPEKVELNYLLNLARQRNGTDGITGLLLCHDGNVLQVLEGPRQEVLDCYERISSDRRHTGCIVLKSDPIERRNFSGWDMAFVAFSELDSDRQQNFIKLQDLKNTDKMREVKQDTSIDTLVSIFLSGFGGRSFA